MKDNTAIIDALAQILSHTAGFGIELMGVLFVFRMETGKYAVHFESEAIGRERIFDDAREAAQYFVDRRYELQLGFDFER